MNIILFSILLFFQKPVTTKFWIKTRRILIVEAPALLVQVRLSKLNHLCAYFCNMELFIEAKRWYYFSNNSLSSSILVDCKWGEFTCSGSKDAFCDKSGWRTCTRSKITEAENGGKDCEELNDNIKQECQGMVTCFIITVSWRSILFPLYASYLIL